MMTDLTVNRDDLADFKVVKSDVATVASGEALLRIERFALTANNITYAVAPEALGYWTFFPVAGDNHGCIPVWGFASVQDSGDTFLETDSRVYGYFPMSSHLKVEPGQENKFGFMDTAAHRADKSPVYNQYTLCDTDPMYRSDIEGMIALFRPLFTTSFLLDDMIRAQKAFGARQVVLTSASSKTALGLAFCLSQSPRVAEVVGLTSPANVDFVKGLGCYDQVIPYDEIESMSRVPTMTVDMAGNVTVLERLHAHFEGQLAFSSRVGGTHWQDGLRSAPGLKGPRPEFFFAPSYAQQRISEWGGAEFNRRLTLIWDQFIASADSWITISEAYGVEAVTQAYMQTLQGKVEPQQGLIVGL